MMEGFVPIDVVNSLQREASQTCSYENVGWNIQSPSAAADYQAQHKNPGHSVYNDYQSWVPEPVNSTVKTVYQIEKNSCSSPQTNKVGQKIWDKP